MRNRMDSNQACTGLVDKYIGTAYDVVKGVYDNLETIKEMAEQIASPEFQELLDMIDDLDQLSDLLKDFNNRYYGPLGIAPTTRPDGTPIQEGDMYYNTVVDHLYVYAENTWVIIGEEVKTVEIFKITAAQAGPADITLNLENSYVVGTNNIIVFVNSTYQYSISPERSDGSYNETSTTTITFPTGSLEEDDIVAVVSGSVISSANVYVGIDTENYLTSVEGERFILIPGGMLYTPGTENMEVYANGLRQVIDVDYTETDNTHITFVHGLPLNSLVVFKLGNIINTSLSQDLTDQFKILNVVQDFYNIGTALNKSHPIYLKGYNIVNDGGAGSFLYDPLYVRSHANGGTVIDPSVTINNQGSGVGSGCWIRQYTSSISPLWFGKTETFVDIFRVYGALQNGDTVTLDGYRSIADGGEGTFYWDADVPKNSHDGGIIIDPMKVFPINWNNTSQMYTWFTPSSTGFGCWIRHDIPSANINWFGAVGNSVEDNSLVFMGIAEAANQGNMAKIKVPTGTFNINRNTVAYFKSMAAMFELYGEGHNSTISFSGTADPKAIRFADCNGLRVENVTFRENRTSNGTALTFMNCEDVRVNRTYFYDFKGSCITLTENTETFDMQPCDSFRVLNCSFTNSGTNGEATVLVEPKVKSDGLIIKDNWFSGCGSTGGAVIRAGTAMTGGRIEGNTIEGAGENAIEVDAYEDVAVTSNYISEFGNVGILVRADGISNYTSPSCKICDCRDNRFSLASPLTKYGIEFGGSLLLANTMIAMHNIFLNCESTLCTPGSDCANVHIVDNFKTP